MSDRLVLTWCKVAPRLHGPGSSYTGRSAVAERLRMDRRSVLENRKAGTEGELRLMVPGRGYYVRYGRDLWTMTPYPMTEPVR